MRVAVKGIDAAIARLGAVRDRVRDLEPALRIVGELLVSEAKWAIATQTSPDGRPFAPLSQTTLERRVTRKNTADGVRHLRRRMYKKRGGLTKRAQKMLAGAQALVDSKALANGLSARAQGNALRFGTDRVYGRAQQLGNPDNKMFGKWPAPIPARPFYAVAKGGAGLRWMTGARAEEIRRRALRIIKRYVLRGEALDDDRII